MSFTDPRWSRATPVLHGLYPNCARALQAASFGSEILGSSNGEEGQAFQFQNKPVLEGQEIRVREILGEQERDDLRVKPGEGSVPDEDEQGDLWVRWKEVEHFAESTPDSRHYVLDRAPTSRPRWRRRPRRRQEADW